MACIQFIRCIGTIFFLNIFSFTSINASCPLKYADEYIQDKNVMFYKRIVDLAKKVEKCKKNLNSKKAMKTMFEIKDEIESFCQQKFNLAQCFDNLISELRNQGVKLNSKDIRSIWKNKF